METGSDTSGGRPGRGRDETPQERSDRNWNDLLQELRVMQTGAQIITAFLMMLPFQSRFEDLGAFQQGFYIGLLAFSALLTGLIMTPVAIHRRFFGKQVKEATVRHGHRIVKISVVSIGVMVSACVFFIVDVMLGIGPSLAIGLGVLAAVLFLLVALPRMLKPRPEDGAGRREDAHGRH
ncbi:DUF6328 family protein [Zafaria sp. Z1313]|uniref:DUF6328 family protein n=1 Tax=unclassified Zafaria TaxID=2828765 RepID=UPI002E7A39E9|nr:DUF6328 family protein [Zafaria sp. J156]MEE1619822.1 DUF6328 family protein [Zafaria sp. J156]